MSGRFDESGTKNYKLDAKDTHLLELLHENCRESFTSLAKKLRLSRDAVRYRMNKLEKDGIITGYQNKVVLEALGYKRYWILFHLGVKQADSITEFIEQICKQNNIISVMEFSDKWDVFAEIIAKNLEELDGTLSTITNHAEIENSEILLVAEEIKDNNLPVTGQGTQRKKKKEHVCDHKDILLLKAMINRARDPAHSIAKKINMPLETAYTRIKKLQASNIITSNPVQLKLSALGYESYIILVSLKNVGEEEIRTLKMLTSAQEVMSAYRVMGSWNVLLNIVTKEPESLHYFIRHMRNILGPTLREYDVLMSYKEHKHQNMTVE